MRTNTRRSALGVVIPGAIFLLACSDCGQSAIGEKKGQPLVWESISLGVDEAQFRKDAAGLVGAVADTESEIPCRDQSHLSVPDIHKRKIVERSAGTHELANCVVKAVSKGQSSTLVELRAEFVDHRLARLTYRFAPGQYDRLVSELRARFGDGLATTFKEDSLIDGMSTDYRVWRFDEVVWSLAKGEVDTSVLVQHDLKATKVLPEPPPPAKRGKPISLEDLGIGKLDLKAPDPVIELPDTEEAIGGDK
ncbi:MAG: hypothetical protein GY854_29305 [Deltaproteobacteria bacterium]|nr:hypothetical protein [Deltaproteobacteria bacterium]